MQAARHHLGGAAQVVQHQVFISAFGIDRTSGAARHRRSHRECHAPYRRTSVYRGVPTAGMDSPSTGLAVALQGLYQYGIAG